ncbi:DUF2971 domain-containing protein [Rubritalea profundi]|uniref:DUF2971 domain-containing protein n=1 Tax=Rubritalea profundi TaxID=1658618 RepID=A0A2S7TYV8_9BACT|nr:DUF2971 domain-containing protein [Rubritalea profundi]PQJ27447.1 hypothetical protein BSZ32_02335 [Rubritalea profundi]
MSYPTKLYYKYRPLYSDRRHKTPHEFTKSIIKSSELYYATPNTFNDPFDCNLKLHTDDSTDKEWIDYIDSMIVQYPQNKKKLVTVKRKKSWGRVGAIGENTAKSIYEDSSVLCLSKRPDSIPMFSYYADDHYGIAIELQFSDIEVPCGIPYGDLSDPSNLYERTIIFRDVEYPLTIPELNYHRLYGSEKLLTNLIFSKFKEWNHEDEFRIFRRNMAESSVKFPQKMLTRIIFGSRTGQDEIDLVKTWLSARTNPVILAKIEPSKKDFSLNIVDFENYTP